MQTKLALAGKLAAAVLTLFALVVCLSLPAPAQQKMPPAKRSVVPLQPVGPDCTTLPGNLFQNCGFETGDFTGWTVFDSGDMGVSTDQPNNGNFAAFFGSIARTGCIGQTLATNAGQGYTLSFVLTGAERPNNFYVLFNGATVSGDLQNLPDFAYTQYTMGGLTAVGNDTVFFCARNDPSFFFLDDAIFQ